MVPAALPNCNLINSLPPAGRVGEGAPAERLPSAGVPRVACPPVFCNALLDKPAVAPKAYITDFKRGLTLLEVCLVLALLVIIGAVATPVMDGTFSRGALRGASDVLRGAWARSRLAAMESGQTCVFRAEPNGRRFQMVALTALGTPESETLVADSGGNRDVSDMLRMRENRLPEGVRFAAFDVSASSQLMATLGDATVGVWSAPILFNPDGTTSDATVLLANEGNDTIRVTLRGLTGISNIGDVGKEPVTP